MAPEDGQKAHTQAHYVTHASRNARRALIQAGLYLALAEEDSLCICHEPLENVCTASTPKINIFVSPKRGLPRIIGMLHRELGALLLRFFFSNDCLDVRRLTWPANVAPIPREVTLSSFCALYLQNQQRRHAGAAQETKI